MPSRIKYLDAFAAIGMQGPVDAKVPWTMESLLEDMRHTGIHGALVYHTIAREYAPMYGNRHLVELIADEERLFPCWVVLPSISDEMLPPRELVGQMQSAGVLAAKMFPQRHHIALTEALCGELFSALEEAQIPLLLDAGLHGEDQQVTFKEVARLCRNHPDLPLLLQKVRWESTRDILSLMQQFPGISLEFSSFQVNYGLEFMKEKVGIDRLLLGTEWPFKSPGAAKSFIDYSELSEEEKAKVAGGNLAALLNLSSLPGDYPDPGDDLILKKARAGNPLDHIPVIDTHAHVLHDDLMGTGFIAMPRGDAEHMIRRNRRMGIDRLCISSWIGIWIDYRHGNDLVYDLVQRYPDDVIGYATIDPNKSNDYEGDIRRCHDEYGFRGLKPYNPRVGIPYNSPKYDLWYQKGNELGAFVKLHQTAIGDNYLEEVAEIAEKYPNMNHLLVHSGWTWEVARSRVALAKEYDNVYLDLTFTSVLHGVVEYFVEEGLADKVLFNTDAPMRDPIPQLGWVVYSRILERDKKKILGLNALGILEHAGLNMDSLRREYDLTD